MDRELAELRRRVAEVEAELAVVVRRDRNESPRRRTVVATVVAGTLAAALTVAWARANEEPPPLPGPLRVPAPFEVVDGKGRAIFRVQMTASGDGAAILYDDTGDQCAVIGHSPKKPIFQVWKNGVLRGGLGYSGQGSGLIVLDGQGQSSTQIVGGGGFFLDNAEGKDAAVISLDTSSNGFVQVMNRAGVALSEMAVAADGSGGRISVSRPNEIRVLMGILDNGKGDLCANGMPGKQVCLSGLALKSLIPY